MEEHTLAPKMTSSLITPSSPTASSSSHTNLDAVKRFLLLVAMSTSPTMFTLEITGRVATCSSAPTVNKTPDRLFGLRRMPSTSARTLAASSDRCPETAREGRDSRSLVFSTPPPARRTADPFCAASDIDAAEAATEIQTDPLIDCDTTSRLYTMKYLANLLTVPSWICKLMILGSSVAPGCSPASSVVSVVFAERATLAPESSLSKRRSCRYITHQPTV
mmetsp:Transcript_41285/g.100753  ORF Transcript_41285/g.100753 Transcript_41285/m.100753 type:complete len:220 (-) Transcript_41285:641-1300(-)